MSIKNLVVRTLEHNAWANAAYVGWLAPMPAEILERVAASSCPTIVLTLKHIWEAQEYWTGAVGETDDFTRVWELEEPSKQEIFDGLTRNSQRLVEIVSALSEDDLARPFPIKNQWLDCALPKAEYLQQVVSHAAYHRGQIVTIARGFGATAPPMTDFIAWAMKQ